MAVCFCASHSSALFSSFYVPLPCRVLWIFHFFLLLEETVLSPPHLAQCGFNLSIIFPLFFTSVPLLCVSSPGYTSISLGFLPVCFCLSLSIGRSTYNYTYIYHSPLIALSWSHFIFCSSLSSTSLWFSFFYYTQGPLQQFLHHHFSFSSSFCCCWSSYFSICSRSLLLRILFLQLVIPPPSLLFYHFHIIPLVLHYIPLCPPLPSSLLF